MGIWEMGILLTCTLWLPMHLGHSDSLLMTQPKVNPSITVPLFCPLHPLFLPLLCCSFVILLDLTYLVVQL